MTTIQIITNVICFPISHITDIPCVIFNWWATGCSQILHQYKNPIYYACFSNLIHMYNSISNWALLLITLLWSCWIRTERMTNYYNGGTFELDIHCNLQWSCTSVFISLWAVFLAWSMTVIQSWNWVCCVTDWSSEKMLNVHGSNLRGSRKS